MISCFFDMQLSSSMCTSFTIVMFKMVPVVPEGVAVAWELKPEGAGAWGVGSWGSYDGEHNRSDDG